MAKHPNKAKRRLIWLAAGAGLALIAIAAPSLPDINRYLKIRKM